MIYIDTNIIVPEVTIYITAYEIRKWYYHLPSIKAYSMLKAMSVI